jgi:aminoglycoside phosphotransferase (APT) family kinase protein
VAQRDLPGDLRRWAHAHYGTAAEVATVVRMPGHSGISYGFEVVLGGPGGARERLVIRLAPPGVRRVDSTDVVRIVPVLRAMARAGVAVPRLRWWADDERWFGVSYLIVDWVAGATLPDVFDPAAAQPGIADVGALFAQAVDALAAIHGSDALAALRADPSPREGGWSRVRTLVDELDLWVPVLEKAQDPSWVDAGLALRRRLMATAPPDPAPGVVHGDFYSNNWLFDGNRLSAVLDWENAGVGAPAIDIGWLCVIHEPACWGPARGQGWSWAPSVDTLLAHYERASGRALEHPGWYRALGAYRMACITANGLRLHRTGRHPDAIWEIFGDAFDHLIDHAEALLRHPD